MMQIDMNNAKNVEKSLNDEIHSIQHSREQIESELKQHKDRLCKLQVENRKLKTEIDTNYKQTNDQLTSEVDKLKQQIKEKDNLLESYKFGKKERNMIINQLKAIMKLQHDTNDTMIIHENHDYKAKSSNDAIFEAVGSLLSTMGEKYPQTEKMKKLDFNTPDIDSSLFSKNITSTYDYSGNEYSNLNYNLSSQNRYNIGHNKESEIPALKTPPRGYGHEKSRPAGISSTAIRSKFNFY